MTFSSCIIHFFPVINFSDFRMKPTVVDNGDK